MRESRLLTRRTLGLVGLVFVVLGDWSQTLWAQDQSITMDFGQSFYASDIPSTDIAQQYSQLGLAHKLSWTYSDSQAVLWDIGGLVPVSQGADTGVIVRDLYWQVSDSSQRARFLLGRNRQTWSALDDYFSLGVWQPIGRWDTVNPIAMGLTGAFFEVKGERGGITLFLTGIHLPDQMADFEIVDGEMTSSNRWFRGPPRRVRVANAVRDISYEVLRPETADVVFQNGFAARGEWGAARGWFARISYADKPANQFHLGVDYQGAQQVDVLGKVDAEVYPTSIRHQVFATEIGWRERDTRALVSWNRETYDDPGLDPNWHQTALGDGHYIGALASGRLKRDVLMGSELEFGYVKHVEDEANAGTTFVRGRIASSTERLGFEDLWTFGVRTRWLRRSTRQLTSEVKYNYSPLDKGGWLHVGMMYAPEKEWAWRFGADVFGVESDADPSTSFISNYRANDRVSAGVTYVF